MGWDTPEDTMLAPMPPVSDMANQVQKPYLGFASFPPMRMSPLREKSSRQHSKNSATMMSWYIQLRFT